MKTENYIPINQLCVHYNLEMSFFTDLNDYGLIEIITIEKSECMHQDRISDLEKMMRMRRDLNINLEGIDAVFNLLEKINTLQDRLIETQNRLLLYEDRE